MYMQVYWESTMSYYESAVRDFNAIEIGPRARPSMSPELLNSCGLGYYKTRNYQ